MKKDISDSARQPLDSGKPLCIWVDADAVPKAIKDILLRTSKRLQVMLTFVANQSVGIPDSELVNMITVPNGADIADNAIVKLMNPGDIVITQDIPLAARVIEKDGIAIGVRGQVYDDGSIQSRLGTRNLMEQFRAAGIETPGPKPFNSKDLQKFANSLDRTLTRALKKRK